MGGYEIEPWHDFFVAQAGAGAALAGLVFVAISINLTKLLTQRSVQGRAIEALLLLLSILIVGLAALIPGQGMIAFGVELVLFGIALSAGLLATSVGGGNAGGATRNQYLFRIVIGQASMLTTVLGGATLLIGAGGGLYWLAAGTILGTVAGTIGAWVLLVEISR